MRKKNIEEWPNIGSSNKLVISHYLCSAFERDSIKIVKSLKNITMAKFTLKGLSAKKKALAKEVDSMVIPEPSKKISFSMMQKLFAYWVKNNHYYGNWSGTGVGKTYSFILASRVIDAHLTVVIGVNSTTSQLASEITELYDDSVAVVYDGELPDFDMSKHNYLIFNYEKGQQKYSKELFDSVLKKYKVDYIVFDEVQMVKLTDKNCSARRKNLQEFRNDAVKKYDSYVSVLTATPFVNNITEVISILTLMTGEDYSYIKKKNSLKNTIAVKNLLNSLGVRATTEAKNIFGRVIKPYIHTDQIEGDDATFDAFKVSLSKTPLAVYQSILTAKLEYIYVCDQIKRGELAIIYTQFTDGIIEQAKEFFITNGFKVCEYTGKNKDTDSYTDKNGRVDWKKVKDNFDIILASKPIATGVDGLQKVCNKMIILTLPWTDADYTQLIGRIKRKKSVFDTVDICIPIVRFSQANMVGYDDKVWNSIQNKGRYSNACLDGLDSGSSGEDAIHKSIIKELMSDMDEVNSIAA